jgi:ubiquinone/menaquinone biosynthesis C-methylase UbiE
MNEADFYEFEQVELEVKDFKSEGFILDIGGGGEGVIGQLKGSDVVAIDIRKEELEEAAEGPLKIVMDARDLNFLDSSFNTATAFFSLMYIKSKNDQQRVLQEIWRVLKIGSTLYIWDIDLSERPNTDKEFYVIRLLYKLGKKEFKTGYGQRWPKEARGEKYYIALAEEAGFQHVSTERNKKVFHMLFKKA